MTAIRQTPSLHIRRTPKPRRDDAPYEARDAQLRPDANTTAERRAASLTVAAHARSVADCVELLGCLGLLGAA